MVAARFQSQTKIKKVNVCVQWANVRKWSPQRPTALCWVVRPNTGSYHLKKWPHNCLQFYIVQQCQALSWCLISPSLPSWLLLSPNSITFVSIVSFSHPLLDYMPSPISAKSIKHLYWPFPANRRGPGRSKVQVVLVRTSLPSQWAPSPSDNHFRYTHFFISTW